MKWLLLNLTLSLSFASEILYVQSLKAPLLSEPKLGSKELASIRKGESLKVIEKREGWFKVEYKNTQGWVSSLLLSNQEPMGKVSVFEEDKSLKETARRRASSYTTAAAARGLLEDRARVSQKYMLDLSSIKWLEGIKIEEEEVLKFLEEGR